MRQLSGNYEMNGSGTMWNQVLQKHTCSSLGFFERTLGKGSQWNLLGSLWYIKPMNPKMFYLEPLLRVLLPTLCLNIAETIQSGHNITQYGLLSGHVGGYRAWLIIWLKMYSFEARSSLNQGFSCPCKIDKSASASC
jgi:hypothetical protein